MSLTPNVDEQAYVKQMRNVDSNYLPLYDPDPWSGGDVYIGDVGVIQAGAFRPLFNITMKSTHRRNAGGVPENFETLSFSSSSDTYTKSSSTVIKKLDPCCGDSRVSWSRVDDSEGPIQEETEAGRDREYSRFSYSFTKSSTESSYVLLAMSDVEETAVQETQMEAWRHYMEKHHKYWLKYIRKKWLDPNFKAESFVLLCGVVKTSSWVIATLPKEGTYRLDVQDTPVGIQPALAIGGKSIVNGLRYGQDTVEGDREIVEHFAKLAGLRVSDSDEPTRKMCLFLRGLRMEKDFWSPKRVVAAAEPQDPRSGGGDEIGRSPPLLTSDRRFTSRCGLETLPSAIRQFQAPNTSFTACPSTYSLSPFTASPDRTPLGRYDHFRCLLPAPATPFPTIPLTVAF